MPHQEMEYKMKSKKIVAFAISIMVPTSALFAAGGTDHSHDSPSSKALDSANTVTYPERWKAPAEAIATQNPVRETRKSVMKGEELFKKNCVKCHGPMNESNSVTAKRVVQPEHDNPDDLDTDGALAWKIKNGRGHMPTWDPQLTEEDVWHLVNYINHMTKY